MGVRSERRTKGARGGLGLLYSLGVENGSPHRMGNRFGWRNDSQPSIPGARVYATELTARVNRPS